MMTSYDAIYLAPHLDDAVLSCGGQIAARTRAGDAVLVVTLAAGDPDSELTPLARNLHAAWKLEDDFAARREEDRRACALIGADWRHGDTPDGIYRRHPETGEPLYDSLERVFGPAHPEDPAARAWEELLNSLPQAGELFAPLAVRGHVDHRLARRAAESVFGDALWYYEDFPYAMKFGAVRKTVWPPWRWRSRTIRLSSEDLSARCEASAAYGSQIDMLDGGAGRFDRKIRRYARRVGGERLWQRRQSRAKGS